MLERKKESLEMMCVFCNNLTFFLVAKQGTVEKIKNKLRTFQPQKWKKIKNSQPQTKFTGSFIKKNNRAKISGNSDEFLCSLVKRLKIKFLHPMKRSMRMLSFKMRNLRGLKNDIFYQQSRGFFQSSAFRSSRPEVFYKKVALNNFEKFIGKHLCRCLF